MTATRIHLVFGALFGAAGVALLAAGAHVTGSLTTTAGQMLLFHAGAIIAATTARKAGHLSDRLALIGLAGLILGPAVFSADLALRELAGNRLFSMAAPLGGSVSIAGWVLLALAAVTNRFSAPR